MTLSNGMRLAHYVIERPIGSGGMGAVYAAQDTKLKRRVAIKVLGGLAGDSSAQRRLEREAQTIAALNHPHIVTVYAVEQDGEIPFIAMELVDGQTLTQAIGGRPMPTEQLLAIAVDLVDAIAAAHGQGVIHRDIKPGNIMLTNDGRAKVLDFGISKTADDPSRGSTDATMTQSAAGVVVGSAPYMSPEQARGDPIDQRTDIFSVGVTLFEMLTGRRPFDGRTAADLTAAILTAPIELPSPATPLESDLHRVVKRCLAKQPSDRYQTARDLGSELATLLRARREPAAAGGGSRLKIAAVAITVLLAIIGTVAWRYASTASALPSLSNPRQLTSAQGAELDPSWSPDSTRVAYHLNRDVWVSQIGGGSVNLTNSPGVNDRYPAWSPDGSQIAFVSAADNGGLFVVPAVGGAIRKLVGVGSRGSFATKAAWSADGTRLAVSMYDDSRQAQIHIVTLPGLAIELSPASGRESSTGQDLAWSADGLFFAYVDATNPLPEVSSLWLHRLGESQGVAMTDGRSLVSSPQFSRDASSLTYVSNRGGSSDLWSQSLGSDGEPAGEPVRLTTGIGMSSAAFSPDGTKLAYSRGREVFANAWRVALDPQRVLTWGDATQLTADDAFIEFIEVSHDGQTLYLSSDRGGNQDLWRMPAAGGEPQQLTFEASPDWRPTLSPDGAHVAFYSYRTGNRELWRMPSAGGPARQLTFEGTTYHPRWSPDGSRIIFASARTGQTRLYSVSPDGGNAFNIGEPGDNIPAVSPDGKQLAFRRSLSGLQQLFVTGVQGGEAKRMVSARRPGGPIWSRDGSTLYYPFGREVWGIDVPTGKERRVADFSARPGAVGEFSLATDGKHLYFAWQTPMADIWLMDVTRQ